MLILKQQNVESGECIKTLEGHTGYVYGVSFSPNNQYVVSGSGDNTVRIWNVESGDCIKTLEGHTDKVWDVSFSPNNQYVLSEGLDAHYNTDKCTTASNGNLLTTIWLDLKSVGPVHTLFFLT